MDEMEFFFKLILVKEVDFITGREVRLLKLMSI